jgi:hypothetical protein
MDNIMDGTNMDEIGEIKKLSFIESSVNDFYKFLMDELLKYIKLKNVNDTKISKHRSFIDYWCYRLYGDYGIKRRIHKYGDPYSEDEISNMTKEEIERIKLIYGDLMNRKLLIQFFYDKSIPSYSISKSITRICRHLIFDINKFNIVSLGIPKSMDQNDFMSLNNKYNNKLYVSIEEFLEGTMLIYNPDMKRFNYDIVSDNKTDDTLDNSNNSDNKNKKKKAKNFSVSTRRKIGTSFFNKPGKTFYEMFDDNNKSSNIDMESITEDLKNLCLVFNVEHEDNRIISPNINNRNTLVAAYAFKCYDINKYNLDNNIMPLINVSVNTTSSNSDESSTVNNIKYKISDLTKFITHFSELSEDMVKEINLLSIKNRFMKERNIEFNIPKIITTMIDTDKLGLNINKFVNNELSKLSDFSPGIMIKDISNNSMRYKVRKQKYKELLELKGHTPISIHEKNQQNLFKCYWRLRNNGGLRVIRTFLNTFDNDKKEYRELFDNYKKLIHEFTHNLYIEYISVFIEKEKHAKEIPYIYAPLIGDLHKEYFKTKQPTTKNKVINYVNSLPVYKVYWRLFTPNINESNKSNEDDENKSEVKVDNLDDENEDTKNEDTKNDENKSEVKVDNLDDENEEKNNLD